METNQQLKKKTITSAFSLFFQSGYSAVLGFAANLILTIVVSPKIFGIYITVLSLISVLNYFSDIGLAASLVQKKEISDEDVKTTFTIQQLLIITAVIIGAAGGGFVQNYYNLPQEGLYLYWALLASFFLSSLKTIPSIFLERSVKFQKIVIVQITENTVFYIAVIIFALLGFELRSFTFAVLLRSFTGMVLMYSIAWWKPKIGISRASLKQLLAFGVPFQANSFLALFKDDLINLFLGKILGFEILGYVGWAKKWAESPIRIIMDNISRVLFPVIARLQHDKEKVGRLMEKIFYYQTLILTPIMIMLAFGMGALVEIIPKYSKWSPALPFFYIFIISAYISSFSTPLMNLFNALGKVKISFMFMAIWTTATWLMTPFFTAVFGAYGFPIAHFLLSLSSIAVIFRAKKLVSFGLLKKVIPSFTAGALIIVFSFFLRLPKSDSLISLFEFIGFSAVSYFIIFFLFFRINLIKEIQALFIHE